METPVELISIPKIIRHTCLYYYLLV
jgi:hypothetical protein